MLLVQNIFVGYHLYRWKDSKDKNLSNLCTRFLNRNLLKAIEINGLTREKELKALAIARKLSKSKGYDPEICCGLRKQKLYGYYPYKGGLRIWDGQKLEAIENSSSLISSLINPAESTWLIYDREIHDLIENEISILINQGS